MSTSGPSMLLRPTLRVSRPSTPPYARAIAGRMTPRRSVVREGPSTAAGRCPPEPTRRAVVQQQLRTHSAGRAPPRASALLSESVCVIETFSSSVICARTRSPAGRRAVRVIQAPQPLGEGRPPPYGDALDQEDDASQTCRKDIMNPFSMLTKSMNVNNRMTGDIAESRTETSRRSRCADDGARRFVARGRAAGQACSGYLVEASGFRLLVDPATRPCPAAHACRRRRRGRGAGQPRASRSLADLNPLLRARALRRRSAPPLPVHALPGALDAILALDHRCSPSAATPTTCTPSRSRSADDRPVRGRRPATSHSVPNAGFRITRPPSSRTPAIAARIRHWSSWPVTRCAVAEASYVDRDGPIRQISADSAPPTRRLAGQPAAARRLMLTHLLPAPIRTRR